jgi:hypothetical protein
MKVSRISRLCVVVFMLVYGVGWSVAVPQSLQLHTTQSLTGTGAVGEGCACDSTTWYRCASYPNKNCTTDTGGCNSSDPNDAGTCRRLEEDCFDDINCAGRRSYGCVI